MESGGKAARIIPMATVLVCENIGNSEMKDLRTKCLGLINFTLRPLYAQGASSLRTTQKVEWAPDFVWTGGEEGSDVSFTPRSLLQYGPFLIQCDVKQIEEATAVYGRDFAVCLTDASQKNFTLKPYFP
jgi:hypothetical protein